MQTAVKHKKNEYRLEERESGANLSDIQFYLINFLQEYGQKVLFGFLFAIALFVLFYRMGTSQSTGSVQDYINVQEEFAQFQDASSGREGAYENLERMIEENPELQSKYDGQIAQALIIEDRSNEAAKYVTRSLQRTQMDQFPYYADFAQTTLDIAGDRFSEALERTESLRKTMESAASYPYRARNHISYALNLLREAVLNKQLGFYAQELSLLNDLSAFIEKPENAYAKESLLAHFQNGSVDLFDYIQFRKTEIANEIQ